MLVNAVIITFFAVKYPNENRINLYTYYVFRWNDMHNKASDGMVRMVFSVNPWRKILVTAVGGTKMVFTRDE